MKFNNPGSPGATGDVASVVAGDGIAVEDCLGVQQTLDCLSRADAFCLQTSLYGFENPVQFLVWLEFLGIRLEAARRLGLTLQDVIPGVGVKLCPCFRLVLRP